MNSIDAVMKYTSRLVQYYRKNAKYLEHTYGFIERRGIEKILGIFVEELSAHAWRKRAPQQYRLY